MGEDWGEDGAFCRALMQMGYRFDCKLFGRLSVICNPCLIFHIISKLARTFYLFPPFRPKNIVSPYNTIYDPKYSREGRNMPLRRILSDLRTPHPRFFIGRSNPSARHRATHDQRPRWPRSKIAWMTGVFPFPAVIKKLHIFLNYMHQEKSHMYLSPQWMTIECHLIAENSRASDRQLRHSARHDIVLEIFVVVTPPSTQ